MDKMEYEDKPFLLSANLFYKIILTRTPTYLYSKITSLTALMYSKDCFN